MASTFLSVRRRERTLPSTWLIWTLPRSRPVLSEGRNERIVARRGRDAEPAFLEVLRHADRRIGEHVDAHRRIVAAAGDLDDGQTFGGQEDRRRARRQAEIEPPGADRLGRRNRSVAADD